MFRVDSTTWINPKAVCIKKVNIDVFNNWGDEAYSVSIETDDDDCYISDTFPTFEEAEAYVQKLIDQLK